ncbi:lysophospholipid acyltransferase family protein [Roseicyclus mahoneyensis]|jgi:Kdo2-lipid IVA lauroyltransferase/acyltransferase|uniref:KDO2-lipid IV(A) lauroyltransferase n=1 Tax=Roseicyclus mahoneyensis TaxID=164332 RepID=A0A316GKD6_9RHOB|nr:lysophospholipid acyltransferase family protein [Roseicyclus mahoneyensis]PWK60448.1 KDO2-lipid IV(A) lauroyltransferase [Roseicyclus mahoneyensis]
MAKPRRLWVDWTVDRCARGLLWAAFRLPYARRVPMMGAVFRALGGITGFRTRAEEQLAYIHPEMRADERRRIADAVLDNFGRVLIENYSTTDQLEWAKCWQPRGPGLETCEQARRAGRAILFVSGHFGNYQAARAAMNVRGYQMGGLYRLMNNPYANAHYVASVEGVGGRAFPRDRRGLAGFVRVLRDGGQGAILIDQYFSGGEPLDFLGKPAPTVLSAGELALKYDALLVPIYAERQDNGLDFDVTIETPIPHTDARTMTQALNDSLGARVRARPDQWFWVHRRWKPLRQAGQFPPLDPDSPATEALPEAEETHTTSSQ